MADVQRQATLLLLHGERWETNCRGAGHNGSRPQLMYSIGLVPLITAGCHRRSADDHASGLRAAAGQWHAYVDPAAHSSCMNSLIVGRVAIKIRFQLALLGPRTKKMPPVCSL